MSVDIAPNADHSSSNDAGEAAAGCPLLTNLRTELLQIGRIAVPCAMTMLLRSSLTLIITTYSGHFLDSVHFASVATGLSFTSLTALSIGAGISSALDTLSTQAYGRLTAKHRQKAPNRGHMVEVPTSADDDAAEESTPTAAMTDTESIIRADERRTLAELQGCYLRQSLAVTLVVYIPINALYLIVAPLINRTVVPEMAVLVVHFLRWSWVIVVPMLVSSNIIRFAQAQHNTRLGLTASLFGTVNLCMVLFAIRPTDVDGMIKCLAVNRWLISLVAVGLLWRTPELREGWGRGWAASLAAGELSFEKLKTFFLVGFPSLVANCADTWCFEILVIIAAGISPVASAAWSVQMTIYGILFAVFVGLSNAASITVGTAVGAGSATQAKRYAFAVVVVTVVVGAFLGMLLFLEGSWVYGMIQSNPEVTACGASLMNYGAIGFAIDVLFYVLQGVFRGIGRAKMCAVAVLIGMWLVALPAAVLLGKVVGLGVNGIMIGLISGLLVSTPLQGFILTRYIDWGECVAEAHARHQRTDGDELTETGEDA